MNKCQILYLRFETKRMWQSFLQHISHPLVVSITPQLKICIQSLALYIQRTLFHYGMSFMAKYRSYKPIYIPRYMYIDTALEFL